MTTAATTAPAPAALAGTPDRSGKYLVFALGGEEYGVEVSRVREIIGPMPITRVPRVPESVRGVINLRGKVIPVVDLRIRFGLEAIDHGLRTCIIVVQAAGAEFGVVVDRVSEVAVITGSEIENAPAFGPDIETPYLLGIARAGPRVRLLLDIERVLSREEMAALPGAAALAGLAAAAGGAATASAAAVTASAGDGGADTASAGAVPVSAGAVPVSAGAVPASARADGVAADA
jgi:purine-binding chemotaxis protein CheW